MSTENSFAANGATPAWREGMLVEWRGLDGTGRIVHAPEDQNNFMVEVLEETEDGWEPTGYTHTAGYQDVVPVRQSRRASEDTYSESDVDDTFAMAVEFSAPAVEALAEGFNKYGVRQNDDGSIDVRFDAMEPGVRKGYEITPEFLENVASKEYSDLPLQLDHSKSQRANAGTIDASSIQFNGSLQVQAHVPNTGSSLRDDIIADFTHEPPQITDISVGFDPDTIEVEPPEERGGKPRFVDARIREFSLTPFPAGYENGGLTPAFSEVLESVDEPGRGCADPKSQLEANTHNLIRK